MNTIWMETYVCESTRWDSRTRGKRIACTDNEEHHSLDTVPRTLFSAVKLSNVMFRSSPKGLHSSPQGPHSKTTGRDDLSAEDAASSQQEDGNKAAAYDIQHFFSQWPVGKTDIHFKQTRKNGQNQQLCLRFVEAEVRKSPTQKTAL